jgi:hypothetical protein
MKLFNCFSAPGYHTSIISTFGVDFDAYEAIALHRLRDAGCNNNILIADARMLVQAMGDEARRPRFAGWRYSVVGAQSSGVFHPKLILQLGKSSGRLLVASANTTAAGLAGNLEVVGEVTVDDANAQAAPLLRAAVDYLAQFIAPGSMPRKQLEWAMTRARWLPHAPKTADVTVELTSGARLGFRAKSAGKGLGEAFGEFVGERSVKRFIVASPYWDHDLRALRGISERIGARHVAVLVQKQAALFPVHALGRSSHVRLFDVNRVPVTNVSRFAHAKLFVAESDEGDCVLFGSANCTTAALGTSHAPGANEEACLCRDLPPGEAVKALGLEAALSAGAEVEPADMPAFTPSDDIPLAEFEARIPGRFEVSGDQLRWWPPRNLQINGAEVELFDKDGRPIDRVLSRIGVESNPASYRIEGRIQPHFAKVRAGDFESSLAVVIVEEAIREAQRRTRSRGAEKALDLLDDDAFEGLWVMEVIQMVVVAEEGARAPRGAGEASRRTRAGDVEEGASNVLPYEQFIAGRRAEGDQTPVALSHLASTHHESVRGFLNALLGKHAASDMGGGGDEGPAPDLGMGDETADGALAMEADERFNTAPEGTGTAHRGEEEAKKLRRRQEYVKDTQKSLVEAVERFLSGFHTMEVRKQPLGVLELLRLRALLVIVLGAASNKSDLLPKDLNAPVLRRQVLPSRGEANWRWLVGRLLYDFFRNHDGLRRPLVERLVLTCEEGQQGFPEDVIETWSTCFWAACAARVATDDKGAAFELSVQEDLTALDLYCVTRLPEAQAMGNVVHEVFDGMSRRYGVRLGVVTERVSQEHKLLMEAAKVRARLSK